MSANANVVSMNADNGGMTLEQKKARLAELAAAVREAKQLQAEVGALNAGDIERLRFAVFVTRKAMEPYEIAEKALYNKLQELQPTGMTRITFRETGGEAKKFSARFEQLVRELGNVQAVFESVTDILYVFESVTDTL